MTCGSSLVGMEKQSAWTHMSTDSRRNVAASLIKSLEQVSKQMMTVFDKPTVETIVEDNMGMF